MTIATALITLCDSLHAMTGVEAAIGYPAELSRSASNRSVLIWPWKMAQDNARKNQAALYHDNDGIRASSISPLVIVDCLIFAQAGNTLECLTMLETMQRSLLDQPLMQAADHSVVAKVMLNELPVDQLTALFSSASIPLTICLSLRLISEDKPVAEKKDSAPVLTRRKVKLPR